MLLALAGAALGPAAMVLGLPAGLVAALATARVQARQRTLRALSRQDALTGLANRRALDERLAYEVVRHRRHEREFAVVALDLDGFKGINDRFGHAAGDEVLVEVAGALVQTVRDQDTVVRLGGDEFCVLAPESDTAAAERLAARLRGAVAGAVVGLDGLAVSTGWAVFPDDGVSSTALLEAADRAAMDAKVAARAGRARRAA